MTAFTLPYDSADFEEHVRVSEEEITPMLCEMPGLLAYYGQILVEAEANLSEEKNSFDLLYAEVFSDTKRNLEMTTSGKVTKTFVEQTVEQNSRIIGAKKKVRKAEKEAKLMKVLFQAIETKMRALMSLGAIHRAQISFQDPTTPSEDPLSRNRSTRSFHGKKTNPILPRVSRNDMTPKNNTD